MMIGEEFRECGRGARCSRAAPDQDGHWVGEHGPRAYCETDERIIRDAMADMPTIYKELRVLIGDQPATGTDSDKISITRTEAPMPLRADVDALCCEIEQAADVWGDRVRESLGMGPAGVRSVSWAHRRDAVWVAYNLMVNHPLALLSLPLAWMPTTRGGHDEQGGVDAGLDMLDLHRRADRAARPVRPTFTVMVPCPGCQAPWMLRRGGEESPWCQGCGHSIPAEEYEELTRDRLNEGKMAS